MRLTLPRCAVVAALLTAVPLAPVLAQSAPQLLDLGRNALGVMGGAQQQQAPAGQPGKGDNGLGTLGGLAGQMLTGGSSAPAGSAGGTNAGLGAGLSQSDISGGLKDALRLGAEHVTSRLGKTDGFNSDPVAHIPLPGPLKSARQALQMAGALGLSDDLELRLNRAAEAATPPAKKIFVDAVQAMSVDDARRILTGPNDAATQYFRQSMTPQLKTTMRPVIGKSLGDVGAVAALNKLSSSAPMLNALGSPGDMLTDHVLDAALEGIFHYLAEEEADIRANPAKRGTDLLKKVFSR